MKDFAGKFAVITGGGTGMGRELARQLVAEGCNVAMCDVSARNMAETKRLCEEHRLPQGLRITTCVADVSDEAQVLRFRASVGPRMPHTAYAAAKFAVKGFSEALIADLRVNAPHIKVSVVMPGHIGTGIAANSRKIQAGNESDEISATELAQARARVASTGKDPSTLS